MARSSASASIEKIFSNPHYTRMRKQGEERKEREKHLKGENLDTLAHEALRYHTAIFVQNKRGIRDSDKLDELYQRSAETEEALRRRLFHGESLANNVAWAGKDVLEYVLVNFHRSRSSDASLMNSSSALRYSPSAFSFVLRIKDFFEDIKKLKGEQYILTTHFSKYGSEQNFELSFVDKGIIAGVPNIEEKVMGEYHHRTLGIPVEKRYQLDKEKGCWTTIEDNRLVLDNELIREKDGLLGIKGLDMQKGIKLESTRGPYFGGTTAFTRSIFYVGNEIAQPIINEIDNNFI